MSNQHQLSSEGATNTVYKTKKTSRVKIPHRPYMETANNRQRPCAQSSPFCFQHSSSPWCSLDNSPTHPARQEMLPRTGGNEPAQPLQGEKLLSLVQLVSSILLTGQEFCWSGSIFFSLTNIRRCFLKLILEINPHNQQV